MKTNSFIL